MQSHFTDLISGFQSLVHLPTQLLTNSTSQKQMPMGEGRRNPTKRDVVPLISFCTLLDRKISTTPDAVEVKTPARTVITP